LNPAYFNDDELDHYNEITAKWLASKTEQQQKIWKLYNKGTPKKTIAKKLSKDPKYVRDTIQSLTKDFNKKIPTLLKE
jgi:DNA-binding NarL/FixJ family response regulator